MTAEDLTPLPAETQSEVTPLTYEQEVHALLWAGLVRTRDFVRGMEQDLRDRKMPKEERRIVRRSLDWMRSDVARFEAIIPLAEARRALPSGGDTERLNELELYLASMPHGAMMTFAVSRPSGGQILFRCQGEAGPTLRAVWDAALSAPTREPPATEEKK